VIWGRNNLAVRLAEVPVVSPEEFKTTCVEICSDRGRITALLALPRASHEEGQEMLAVLAADSRGGLGLLRTRLAEDLRYPALSTELPQAQAFEREIHEEHGIQPEGHPWAKPLRRHSDLEELGGRGLGGPQGPQPGVAYTFFLVDGPGIHEVAVGPVHAGIIEPGHFRFQCHGETVLHLEIQLGYQHRGAEALLLRSTPARRLAVAESIAGDTSIGHGLAYCMVLEALADMEPPLAAQAVRGIALVLERVANHAGDLGALCSDIGYLPGASWFGRLRGEFLNLLLELSGNRFGRGLLRPGGVRFGITGAQRKDFLARLARAKRDAGDTAELTFNTPSVGSRFEETGILTREVAEELGLVGPAARASGCDRDARRDHPFGVFRFAHIPVALVESGDVMARALVRWLEMQRSITFLEEQITELREDSLWIDVPALRPDSLAVSLVEGWRGEIAHVAVTGAEGELTAYKIVDPSFHNWFGLAMAMRGNEISDFPLCNKSFNLSYAGHDL
jgi:Ni,Fe-hydrogenase III large subunit